MIMEQSEETCSAIFWGSPVRMCKTVLSQALLLGQGLRTLAGRSHPLKTPDAESGREGSLQRRAANSQPGSQRQFLAVLDLVEGEI